jgi:hypothetical protein
MHAAHKPLGFQVGPTLGIQLQYASYTVHNTITAATAAAAAFYRNVNGLSTPYTVTAPKPRRYHSCHHAAVCTQAVS